LPVALVTLGSDQNLKVKYAGIYAFGALYITILGTARIVDLHYVVPLSILIIILKPV
jgi:hypothetical protein